MPPTRPVRTAMGWASRRKPRRKNCIDRKSTRLNSSHLVISYAHFCLKKQGVLEMLEALLERRVAEGAGAVLQLVPVRAEAGGGARHRLRLHSKPHPHTQPRSAVGEPR